MEIRKFIYLVAFLVLASGIAGAHHGVMGLYDTSTPIVLEGRVTRATFSPPHPVVVVAVERPTTTDLGAGRPDEFTGPPVVRPEDVGVERTVELSPVQTFYALWSRIKVGNRVTILALRNCRDPHELRSSWIRLEDGTVVSYDRGLHRKTDGCP
ncbi:hypothetical protein [Methylobrevis pamukkalensis]|uniref:Uncharacterized protein n=1 Tax=Methylobrevis pamukkalensis TaxID=1439726 RepID=A0A1E3GWT5_9HYPH|nr:hypothetical protein [Methylobrevis pamukkalensis]ODN68529.1 hypothetical protein A6302_04181 [Methylobrevis pamukkalensis]